MRVAGTLRTVVAAGIAGLTWATVVEPRWFALRTTSAAVLRPAARGSLTVLHLSDLHLQPRGLAGRASRANALAHFLDRCHAADPDLVVATGDLLGHADVVDDALALLGPLASERPGLVSLGSNDYFGPTPKNPLGYLRRTQRHHVPGGTPLDTAELVQGLAASGWTLVENARARVTTRVGPVDVVGLGDAHIDADAPGDLDWSPPGDDTVLHLGVAHAPYARVLQHFDNAGCDIALCGHTHGGQVRLPGIGALVTNCDLPVSQAAGLSQWGDGLPLHVSAGLGMSRYAPVRFACRPEATLLRLTPGPGRSPHSVAPATRPDR